MLLVCSEDMPYLGSFVFLILSGKILWGYENSKILTSLCRFMKVEEHSLLYLEYQLYKRLVENVHFPLGKHRVFIVVCFSFLFFQKLIEVCSTVLVLALSEIPDSNSKKVFGNTRKSDGEGTILYLHFLSALLHSTPTLEKAAVTHYSESCRPSGCNQSSIIPSYMLREIMYQRHKPGFDEFTLLQRKKNLLWANGD